jgi:hypothetical protein
VVVQRRGQIIVYIGDGQWQRFNLETLEEDALALEIKEQIALARRARG